MKELRRTKPGSPAEGFTLIEMLVSVTLIALIALCVWGALRITITSWKHGTDSIDANQQRRTTYDLMEKQVSSMSSLLPPPDPDTGIGQYPIFVGSDSAMQFLSPCAFRFQESPGMTFAEYDIVPDQEGGYSLIEKDSPYLGGDPTQAEVAATGDESGITIFDHLASASFEYFDPGTQDTEPQWVTDWNGLDYMSLPAAVKITLVARDASGGTRDRQIVIPIASKINNTLVGFMNPAGLNRRTPNAGGPRTKK